MAALAHSPSYRETAAGLAATGVLFGPQTVTVHELTGGWVSARGIEASLRALGRNSEVVQISMRQVDLGIAPRSA